MKNIAITMGDPAGIGPEVIVKALASGSVSKKCRPLVVGDSNIMKEAVRMTGSPVRIRTVKDVSASQHASEALDVLHCPSRLPLRKGRPSAGAGRAVVKYVRHAVSLALEKKVHAIVTAPLSKESLMLAGMKWPGHTEMLAALSGVQEAAMMFVSKRLRLILCTIHVPLQRVPKLITTAKVVWTIKCAAAGMQMLGKGSPRIAVAGLNPHAGEAGIMGSEEQKSIIPAIRKARQHGYDVSGPYPPDVVFHRAYNRECDIVVCMYHDQGLIPFKMIAFDSGVNATVGLPFVRTSPDHGTAFDIAWRNEASPSSMIEAMKLAVKMKMLNE